MKILPLIFLFALLLITNRWLSFEEGITFLKATDTESYMTLARSIFGSSPEGLPYHHAQRFALPYFVGTLAHFTGISIYGGFIAAALALSFGIILLTDKILRKLDVTGFNHTICMALIILNPYVFRYYLSVPAMSTDLLLVFGICLSILGLLEAQILYVLVGIILATLGRQTALLLLPGFALWIFFGKKWQDQSPNKKIFLGGLITVTLLSTYILTAKVAQRIGGPGANIQYFFGMYHWLRDSFNFKFAVEFLVRTLTPLLFPLLMIAGLLVNSKLRTKTLAQQNPEILICLFLILSMLSQPLLGDPVIFWGNMTRYSAQTFIFALIALAVLLRQLQPFQNIKPVIKYTLLGTVFLGSFHHMYTFAGGAVQEDTSSIHALYFFLSYLGLAVISGALIASRRHFTNAGTSTH